MQGAFSFYQELPARPRLRERLFFGLLPAAEHCVRIDRLRNHFMDEHGLEGAPVPMHRLHVSLHHVGDYRRLRDPVVYAARQAARAVAMPPFDIAFASIRTFDIPSRDARKRVLVLLAEGDGVLALHAMLGLAMARRGFRVGTRFTPHLTLLYGAPRVPVQPIAPIRFAVRDFALIHSERGLGRHKLIDRWPLDREPADHSCIVSRSTNSIALAADRRPSGETA